jgi:hypothetical protein
MIVRTGCIGLIALTVALAQNPPGPGGPRRFSPPPDGAFPGARFLGAEPGMPGRTVKNAPFSADVVTESTQTLGDGNHIKQSATVHFSRDSEGRTRREQSLNSLGALGSNRTVVFIDDPVAGASYALMPDNKTANKSVRPGRGAGGPGPNGRGGLNQQRSAVAGRGPGRGPRNNQNVKTESLGTQTIEGVQAQGTRTTMTIPAGQMGNEQPIQVVTERWYSSDLQTTIMVKRSDPRSGDTVTRYTNISRAEPVPTQFQVPADYKVQETGRGRGNQ